MAIETYGEITIKEDSVNIENFTYTTNDITHEVSLTLIWAMTQLVERLEELQDKY